MRRHKPWIFSHSIFAKIIHIVILTGFLLLLLTAVFFQLHFNSKIKTQYNTNLKNYCEYLTTKLQSPPDTALAYKISKESAIEITYINNKYVWSTKGNAQPEAPGIFTNMVSGILEDDKFEFRMADGSRYIFASNFYKMIHPNAKEFIFIDLGILLIMLLTHRLLRRVLIPIKKIESGVEHVSNGDFSYEIPVKGKDELARLSASFNQMGKKIAGMIKARDQLLLNVSHELRSPLTRMKLALEFTEDSRTRNAIIEDIREMEIMITELLETERLNNAQGSLKKTPADLAALLRDIAECYSNSKPGVKYSSDVNELTIDIDPERFRVAINNLIENALKYSHSQSAPVEISLTHSADEIFIKIKDDGIGIPEENLPYIFETFYRGDRSRSKSIKGYGLGLSLCKKIIEAHNGNISVSNNSDRGVTVMIVLSDNNKKTI